MADPGMVEPQLARRVALEAAPTPASAGINQVLVAELRKQIQTDPENALKVMGGREVPSREVAMALLDQKISPSDVPVNPVTGIKDRTDEAGRITNGLPVGALGPGARPINEINFYNQSETRMKDVYDFLEKGTVTPVIRAEVLKSLYNDPGYREILKEVGAPAGLNIDLLFNTYITTPAAIPVVYRNLLDSIISHPEYNAQLRKLVKDRLQVSEIKDDPALELRKRLAADIEEHNAIQIQLGAGANSLPTKITAIDAELVSVAPTSLKTRLANAMTNRNIHQTTVTTLGGTQAALQNALSRANSPAQQTAAETALDTFNNGASGRSLADARRDLQKSIDDINEITQEQKDLKDQRMAYQQQVAAYSQRLPGLLSEIANLSSSLMPYENKRRMEEQLFVDNLRFIFTDTAKEYLDARMGRIQGVIEKVQGELKATADKAVAELIEKKTKERWFRKSTGKLLGIFERKISIDKKRTLQDYEIFKSQGVDGLVRAMMKGDVDQMVRKKYGVMALTPAMQAEVDAKLKEIAGSELATNMTVQMLAWSYRLGKRPGANEAMYLEKRNPGRLLQGFESDDGFKVQMQELINKGAVQEPKHFWQNISRFFSGGMTGVPATP